MRHPLSPLVCALLGILASPGCLEGGQPDEGDATAVEDVAEAASRFENQNAMDLNAMDLNAMDLNAMDLNALNLGALSPLALASIQNPGSAGDLARQALRYMVSCALDTSQFFSFTWVDASAGVHVETYWGTLGLAPSWLGRSLSASERRWISACLISRVNWYGVPVMLSSRGSKSPLNHTSLQEASAYSVLEGAFWGDLFGEVPKAYACNTPANIGAARERMRDCAAGHVQDGQVVECGIMHIVGPCESVCDEMVLYDKLYYPSCTADAVSTTSVVTVWLAP